MATPTPERSLQQRRDALQRANDIRSQRAVFKRDLKNGLISVQPYLLDPPEWMETMRVYDLLMALPKKGRVKVSRILQTVRMSPSKTLGGLSPRQRAELLSLLRH